MLNRTAIGLIAVGLLAVAAGLWLTGGDGAAQVQFRAACLRMGLATAALWFAHPQLRRLPGWLIGSLLVLAIVVAVRPRLFPVALVLGAVLLILRPRWKPRASGLRSGRNES